MELAGLKVVLDMDVSMVASGVTQINNLMQQFSTNIKSAFSSIPDLKGKLNIGSDGSTAQAISESKSLQQQRRLEIAGRNELLAVNKAASDIESKANIDANRITIANIQASINAFKQKQDALKRSASEAVAAYNIDNQAQIDNLAQTKKIQASIDAINRKKGQDAKRDAAAKAREKDLYGQLVAESQALVREYYNAAASQIKFGDASEVTKEKLDALRTAAKAGQDQLQKIEQGAGRFQRNVGNYASGFNPLNNSIVQLTREFPAFANGIQTGLLAMSNNWAALDDAIKQAIARNAELVAKGQPTVSVFKQVAGAIFSWQTALQVGITALTIYGPKIYEAIKGTDKATESQKKYAEALNEASKSAQVNALEEVNKLSILSRIAQDNNQKLSERKEAVEALRRIAPEYFKDLSNETILYGDISSAVRLATSAILANAKAKAFAGQADVAAKRYVEEYDALNKVTQKTAEYLAKNGEVIKQQEMNAAASANQASNARISGVVQTKQLGEYLALEKQRKEALDNTLAAQKDIIKFQNLAASNTVDVKDAFGGGGKEKAVKDIRTASDAYQELLKRNQIADAELLAGATSFQETLKKKISNYRSFIVELTTTKIGLSLDNSQVNEAFAEIDKLSNEIAKVSKLEPLDTSIDGKKFVNLAKDISTVGPAATRSFSEFREQVDKGFKSQRIVVFTEEIGKILSNVNTMIADTLAQTAVLVAEGIGNIIAGTGGVGALFKNIGQLLGDQIIAFGKQLIAAGTLMQAAQAAIKSLSITPVLAVVAGGAAIALGAALKAALSKSAGNVGRTKFADGGVVYGPTNALVGEYSGARGNPEVIAPLDKLTSILRQQNIGSKGQMVIIPDVRLSGQDILLSFERAKKAKDR